MKVGGLHSAVHTGKEKSVVLGCCPHVVISLLLLPSRASPTLIMSIDMFLECSVRYFHVMDMSPMMVARAH